MISLCSRSCVAARAFDYDVVLAVALFLSMKGLR